MSRWSTSPRKFARPGEPLRRTTQPSVVPRHLSIASGLGSFFRSRHAQYFAFQDHHPLSRPAAGTRAPSPCFSSPNWRRPAMSGQDRDGPPGREVERRRRASTKSRSAPRSRSSLRLSDESTSATREATVDIPVPIDEAFRHFTWLVPAVAPYVSGPMGLEINYLPPMKFSIAPHESMVLTCSLAARRLHRSQGRTRAEHCVTGIRQWTGSFIPAGRCVTLFALLTPLGSVHVLDSQPLSGCRASGRAWPTCSIGARRSRAGIGGGAGASIHDKLKMFASWLERCDGAAGTVVGCVARGARRAAPGAGTRRGNRRARTRGRGVAAPARAPLRALVRHLATSPGAGGAAAVGVAPGPTRRQPGRHRRARRLRRPGPHDARGAPAHRADAARFVQSHRSAGRAFRAATGGGPSISSFSALSAWLALLAWGGSPLGRPGRRSLSLAGTEKVTKEPVRPVADPAFGKKRAWVTR